MKIKILLLILALCISDAEVTDWSEISTQDTHYKLYYSATLKTSKWIGYPDPNYSWEGESLSYERTVKNEDGKDVLVKTYKDPIEIIADFEAESKVFGIDNRGAIERATVAKFGGSLKGFIWLDNVNGGGEVILPFTAPYIFIASGDRLNPVLTEIFRDPNDPNGYYETVIDGAIEKRGTLHYLTSRTYVYVKSFSGVGGAAGAPSTLIAHYTMNDDAATAVVVDETGGHNGEYQLNSVAQNTDTGASTGKINGALDFVGGANGEHVEIADHDDFTPALTPFSISAWVYMHDATNFTIASKGVYNTDGEWVFAVGSDDTVYFYLYDESVDSCRIGRRYDTAITAYENQWIHLVTTYDGGALSSGLKIYLDSVRVDNNTRDLETFVAVENLTHAVWIGRHSTTYANGVIDNKMFFSTELTLREVDFLYNYGMGREDFVHMAPLLLGTNF